MIGQLAKRAARVAVFMFTRIAEPRVIRVVLFVVYITFAFLGTLYLIDLPRVFEGILGDTIAVVFGGAIAGGGAVGAIAILPGWWWLERLGIISLWTALGLYLVVAFAIGTSSVGIAVVICLAGLLGNRWLQERLHQLRYFEE